MPFRNVLRTPRRTLLTALGIAAAIATLVGVVGMIDSFLATIDRGEAEIVGTSPDRLIVDLDFFYPTNSSTVRAVTGSHLLRTAEAGLTVGGTLDPEGRAIDVLIRMVPLDSKLWAPTASKGSLHSDKVGIVIAEKAASDLGVGVGDTVVLRHPRRQGVTATFVETRLPIIAIHPNPYRFIVYIDARFARLMNLDGLTNSVQVAPAAGVADAQVQRGLFGQTAVSSVQPVSALADAIREAINESLGIFNLVQGAVLVLALLIAFNASSINVDERAREHATMFAFGLPVRRVMGIAIIESLVTGLIGTLGGIAAGRVLLEWLIRSLIPNTLPDIGIDAFLAGKTIATAFALGIVAVAVAPLFTLRRLRRMDISSTLRVVE